MQSMTHNAVAQRVWWAWFWRSNLFVIPLHVLGMDFSENSIVAYALDAAGLLIEYGFMGYVFHRAYPHFEVAIRDNTSDRKLPPNAYRTLCMYWSFMWRISIITLVTLLPLSFLTAFVAELVSRNAGDMAGFDYLAHAGVSHLIFLLLIHMIAGMYIFRVLMGKRYETFHIDYRSHTPALPAVGHTV